MTNRISMILLVAAMLTAPAAFARPVNPAELDSPIAQARADLTNANCVLADEDSRCISAR
jgi:hypothetical protein